MPPTPTAAKTAAAAPPTAAPTNGKVVDFPKRGFVVYVDTTRIVIDLDSAATGKVVAAGEGRRVVIGFAGARVTSAMQGGGQGLVKAWSLNAAGGG